MKVTRRSASVLELRESPGVVLGIAAVFGIGGTWVLLREGERLLAGGFVALVIVLALAFASATTCRFDRPSRTLTCSRRTFRGTSHVRHSLADIVEVRTERSTARQSQAYRVVLVMSSGTTVPLTAHFSSGRAQQEAAAFAIREFLGLAKPHDVPVPGFGDLFRMATGDPAAVAATLGNMYAGAIAHHEPAVDRAPDNVHARRELGRALAMRNRPAEARVHLEHARGVARRGGDAQVASELKEMIGRLA